jgi:hypothetical protein
MDQATVTIPPIASGTKEKRFFATTDLPENDAHQIGLEISPV